MNMYKIAIIENEEKDYNLLKEKLKKYELESSSCFNVSVFTSAYQFLDCNSKDFDIAFIDIQMDGMDGMSLACKIRENNTNIDIIFVTNMANYAIKGYKVNAYDFIVKPVNQTHLNNTMDSLLKSRKLRNSKSISLKCKDQIIVVETSNIIYIEVESHLVSYFLSDGRKIEKWSTLKDERQQLDETFIKPNQYTLVNIKWIESVEDDYLLVKDKKIPISRKYKKEVTDAVMAYYKKI